MDSDSNSDKLSLATIAVVLCVITSFFLDQLGIIKISFLHDLSKSKDKTNAVGQVVSKKKTVFHRNPRSLTWYPIQKGEPILIDESVMTGGGSEVRIRLNGGGELEISENSLINFSKKDLKRNSSSLNIEIFQGDTKVKTSHSPVNLVVRKKNVEINPYSDISVDQPITKNTSNLVVTKGNVIIAPEKPGDLPIEHKSGEQVTLLTTPLQKEEVFIDEKPIQQTESDEISKTVKNENPLSETKTNLVSTDSVAVPKIEKTFDFSEIRKSLVAKPAEEGHPSNNGNSIAEGLKPPIKQFAKVRKKAGVLNRSNTINEPIPELPQLEPKQDTLSETEKQSTFVMNQPLIPVPTPVPVIPIPTPVPENKVVTPMPSETKNTIEMPPPSKPPSIKIDIDREAKKRKVASNEANQNPYIMPSIPTDPNGNLLTGQNYYQPLPEVGPSTNQFYNVEPQPNANINNQPSYAWAPPQNPDTNPPQYYQDGAISSTYPIQQQPIGENSYFENTEQIPSQPKPKPLPFVPPKLLMPKLMKQEKRCRKNDKACLSEIHGLLPIQFQWSPVKGFNEYRVQVASEPEFQIIVVSTDVYDTSSILSLESPGDYYWRVATKDPYRGLSTWSKVHPYSLGQLPDYEE